MALSFDQFDQSICLWLHTKETPEWISRKSARPLTGKTNGTIRLKVITNSSQVSSQKDLIKCHFVLLSSQRADFETSDILMKITPMQSIGNNE